MKFVFRALEWIPFSVFAVSTCIVFFVQSEEIRFVAAHFAIVSILFGFIYFAIKDFNTNRESAITALVLFVVTILFILYYMFF